MDYSKLINGEEYSIGQLFSTEHRKIIIPDFQRDYCWGDKSHGESNTDIVTSFLDTILEEFEENPTEKVLLGKIDVYENPTNHIYLTDGQQRLTTLFLLVGMLYKSTKLAEAKKCLISDFELFQSGKIPYLQYAIRESTLFFLQDLVNDFFISSIENEKVETIKKASWYFEEYNLDPSINSMFLGLQSIESKLKKVDDKIDFCLFIINQVKIQYYNVQNRQHGEERFVIINTTGKSLTISENLKPILLGNMPNEYAKQWEERETFFWKNRKKPKEVIADNGVNEFLTWCFQIIEKQDELNLFKQSKTLLKKGENEAFLIKVNSLFGSLKSLLGILKNTNIQQQFKFITNKEIKTVIDLRNLVKEQNQDVLLPLLEFIDKISQNEKDIYQFIRRLRKNVFDKKWENGNYVDWRYILQIIDKSQSLQDVLRFDISLKNELKTVANVRLNQWYNVEEQLKVKLGEHKDLIEKWEDDADFMGDLSFLFKTVKLDINSTQFPTLRKDDIFNIYELKKIFGNYQKTIGLLKTHGSDNSEFEICNLFRLFRLFIGCNDVGRIYRTSWRLQGVLFSTHNRVHLAKVEFMKLLKSENLVQHCKNVIKTKVIAEEIFDLTHFDINKFIKGWLTLKVFYANEEKVILPYYDGKKTGVAAYIYKDENRLIDNEPFSWSNSICGFAVRSGFGKKSRIHYTNQNLWLNPKIIDTPFCAISIEKEKRTIQQLEQNKAEIERIKKLILE